MFNCTLLPCYATKKKKKKKKKIQIAGLLETFLFGHGPSTISIIHLGQTMTQLVLFHSSFSKSISEKAE